MQGEPLNGTFEDMISFFGISPREGRRWTQSGAAEISFWREGRKLVFGEEGIVEKRARGYAADRRLEPDEAREIARREWREHQQRRRSIGRANNDLEDLRGRVERLEKLLQVGTEAAA